jgi:DNA-directed RNA polymerase specialized sigma24 family protein
MSVRTAKATRPPVGRSCRVRLSQSRRVARPEPQAMGVLSYLNASSHHSFSSRSANRTFSKIPWRVPHPFAELLEERLPSSPRETHHARSLPYPTMLDTPRSWGHAGKLGNTNPKRKRGQNALNFCPDSRFGHEWLRHRRQANMPHSVTSWIEMAKSGDHDAAEQLWQRYYVELVRLCRRKLGHHPRRAADEEDMALSAFASFCDGAQKGNFPLLSDRNNLWSLLVTIAARKVADRIEHDHRQKRGQGKVRGESVFDNARNPIDERGIHQVIGNDPTPDFAAAVIEEHTRLLDRLPDDRLRTIATMKLEAHTNEEIAQHLGCSLRTVERKLWLIRTQWSQPK